ncbi:hypothetical protein [Methylobacterium crusticola]|nr:hypothetical protein [Methylobacterium crusticola]
MALDQLRERLEHLSVVDVALMTRGNSSRSSIGARVLLLNRV